MCSFQINCLICSLFYQPRRGAVSFLRGGWAALSVGVGVGVGRAATLASEGQGESTLNERGVICWALFTPALPSSLSRGWEVPRGLAPADFCSWVCLGRTEGRKDGASAYSGRSLTNCLIEVSAPPPPSCSCPGRPQWPPPPTRHLSSSPPAGSPQPSGCLPRRAPLDPTPPHGGAAAASGDPAPAVWDR